MQVQEQIRNMENEVLSEKASMLYATKTRRNHADNQPPKKQNEASNEPLGLQIAFLAAAV